jgi:tRNA pseudouridine55 synthase
MRMTVPSGVLIVNKPSGPTSHDIVAAARRLFKTRSVGHAGTLDPMASGVLLLLIEEGTKLSSALALEKKSYRARIHFGVATDSDDALGVPIETARVAKGWLDRERLEAALASERTRVEQIPPRVSAIKQDGVTAYRRHRRGESVDLPARKVCVHDLSVIDTSDEYIELSLSVSKGYYVRALARDLGMSLSMPAHLSALCRTSSGCFRLEEAVDWPQSEIPPLLPLADVVRRTLPTMVLTGEGARRARLGQRLLAEHFLSREKSSRVPDDSLAVGWLDESGTLVALGRTEPDGASRVTRGFRALP